jgi:hypothetical protein
MITLIMLLAVITLIALRAKEIRLWLGQPTPVSQIASWLPVQRIQTAPGIVLTHALRLLVRTHAASP